VKKINLCAKRRFALNGSRVGESAHQQRSNHAMVATKMGSEAANAESMSVQDGFASGDA
jgi:hypothetical protein